MSMSVAPHVNLDTLNRLDANKQYFLSSTTGQVKEASIWMRFKCAIGVASARQKVANLVDAVKASLLTAAGQTGNATLDTDIKTVDLTSMVKGSVIKDIAGRFSTANSETILKYDAAKVAKSVGNQVAAKLSIRMFGIGKTDVVGSIVAHALKPMIDDPARLPMKETRDAGGNVKTVLDRNLLEAQLTAAAADAEKLVKSIASDQRLGCPNIDQNYAKHIIATLFNPDGTRNDKTVGDLKTPGQVKVDIAFKFDKTQNVSFERETYRTLKANNIDPEKKIADILKLCDGDKELEELMLEKVPELCVNSNQYLRTEEKTRAMVANIKEAFAEIREVAKDFPGCAASLKGAIASLGSSPIPKGLFRNIANIVKDAKLDKFSSLTSLSSADEIYEGIEQVRVAMQKVIDGIDITKAFEDAGEDEVGGPHMNAARVTTVALALAKAGPGLLARLPNIINGTEFQKMSSTVFMFMADLENGFALPDISDNAAAKDILDNHGLMSSFLQACVEDGLGITLPSVPQIEVNPQEDAVSYMLDTLKASVEAR